MSETQADKLKAVIVDDERLARAGLRALLSAHPEIEVVAEADSCGRAAEVVNGLKPDVVFLDIQMPGESGFELLNKTDADFKIIFVTAFDEHAIRAFEVNALDYLLKPVNPDRLARSIARLKQAEPKPEKSVALDYDDHIFLTVNSRARFVRVSRIVCILAAGAYSDVILAGGEKVFAPKSLKEWEGRLPEKQFLRIHRSTIINLEYVERLEKWLNYSYQVHLRFLPAPLRMSRRYASRVKERLG